MKSDPDKQVSLTDPDARSMMKAGGGSIVGYNVQTAADSKHHLIATHEVSNASGDRDQLSSIAGQAKTALDAKTLTVILMKRFPNVQTEMSLHVLAYNLRRAINVLGVPKIIEQLQTA